MLLVFTLLSMVPLRAAMALPMVLQGAAHQVHALHGAGQMADHASADHAASHTDQDDQRHCGGQCGLCGACHSGLPAAVVSSVIGMFIMPAIPRPVNMAEVFLSPDPRPPRV